MATSKGIALIIAVDLKWDTCMESPEREVHLARWFSEKIKQMYPTLDESDVLSMYKYSIEATRHTPLVFGELLRMQQEQTLKEREAKATGQFYFAFPVKGTIGYVVANDDLPVGDAVFNFNLDSSSLICLQNSGLFSLIVADILSRNAGDTA